MKASGTNSESMQAGNRFLVLRLLSQRDVCTRTELAEEIGLTQASISKIISELIEANLVVEGDLSNGRKGRRAIKIHLNRSFCRIIGVKLARRSFTVGVFDLRCSLLESRMVPFEAGKTKPAQVIEEMIHVCKDYMERYGDVRAIGVAVPGPYLREQGRIAMMSQFEGWDKINIVDSLGQAFRIPVVIEHDTNASACAEWYYGTDGRFRSQQGTLLSVYVGEGVGAGLVVNGRLLHGSDGTAVELGHMSIKSDGPRCSCGNYGCLELYCSSLAFSENVKSGLINRPESSLNAEKHIDAKTVFAHMRLGDAYATEKVREAGRYLGCGLANAVYLYNPKRIVITDEMTGGGEPFLEAVRQTLKERVLPKLAEDLTVDYTSLKSDPVLLGAAVLAEEELFDKPRELYAEGGKGQEKRITAP